MSHPHCQEYSHGRGIIIPNHHVQVIVSVQVGDCNGQRAQSCGILDIGGKRPISIAQQYAHGVTPEVCCHDVHETVTVQVSRGPVERSRPRRERSRYRRFRRVWKSQQARARAGRNDRAANALRGDGTASVFSTNKTFGLIGPCRRRHIWRTHSTNVRGTRRIGGDEGSINETARHAVRRGTN